MPEIRYAFNFSPYKNRSLPSKMPHCINSAALPVTKGVAIEVPVRLTYPPPGAQEVISTPGATRSGLMEVLPRVKPLPENGAGSKRAVS